MKKVITLSVLMITVLTSAALGNSNKTPNIHYKKMPNELPKRISRSLSIFSDHHYVSQAAENDAQKSVRALNVKYHSLNKNLYEKIREAGEATIPAIAEFLSSQDDDLRLKTVIALTLFTKPRESITADYRETEQLLIVLFRGALLDRSSEVRENAVSALAGIGQERVPEIPGDVKLALQEAATSDPSPKVRQLADYNLQDLGLKPKDPKRESIAN